MGSFEDCGIDFGGERFRCAGFHGMDGIGEGHPKIRQDCWGEESQWSRSIIPRSIKNLR